MGLTATTVLPMVRPPKSASTSEFCAGRGAAQESRGRPMNHRGWVLGAVLLGLLGCAHTGQTRFQAAEDTDKENEVKTIGDVTSVANADPVPVSGVGLVVGLEGTGGGAPPGAYRTLLEAELRKK